MSGPQNADVVQNTMKSLIFSALSVIAFMGCSATSMDLPFDDDTSMAYDVDFNELSAPLADISPLFDIRINYFALTNATLEVALQELYQKWLTQSGQNTLPVTLGITAIKERDSITFNVKNMRVREILYIIAELAGSTYIDGQLCGYVSVSNTLNYAIAAPSARRFRYMFVFKGFR